MYENLRIFVSTKNNEAMTTAIQTKKPNEIPPRKFRLMGPNNYSIEFKALGKTETGETVKTICKYDHTYAKWRWYSRDVVELIEYYIYPPSQPFLTNINLTQYTT